jgi:hypothetical protein
MKRSTRLSSFLMFASLLGVASEADAQLKQLSASSNTLYETCSGASFPGISHIGDNECSFSSSPCYANQQAQVRGAVDDALQMISREGVWSKTISRSTTCSTNRSTWWTDGSSPSFEYWYEPESTVAGVCGIPAANGCATYPIPSITWGNFTIANDVGYHVVNQDTIHDYLRPIPECRNMETVLLHEIGHLYGLDHTSSTINVMHEYAGMCNKNYHLGSGRNNFFWPNDNSQMRARYESGSPSGRRNFTASTFYIDAGGSFNRDTPVLVQISASNPNAVIPVKYSFERFFAASGGAIIVQFRWVPGTNSPTYNSTTKTYTWPANTSTYTTRLHTTPSGAVVDNTTLQMTNVNVTRAELPVASGTLYRLWMHVDFSSISTETDEGDNMIPTGYTVVRID